jgi:hypothetical protein
VHARFVRERADEDGGDAGIGVSRPQDTDQRRRGEPVEPRQARAVHHADAVHGNPGRGHGVDHDASPARRGPDPAVERSELLQQHLGVEVVAVAVHPVDDRREPHAAVDGDRLDSRGRGAQARPALDGDPLPRERGGQCTGREQRRGQGGPARGTVDDERRERW